MIQEEDTEFYSMTFGFSFPDGRDITVTKRFNDWTEREFQTVIEELRSCLIACGWTPKLVADYIPETLS